MLLQKMAAWHNTRLCVFQVAWSATDHHSGARWDGELAGQPTFGLDCAHQSMLGHDLSYLHIFDPTCKPSNNSHMFLMAAHDVAKAI